MATQNQPPKFTFAECFPFLLFLGMHVPTYGVDLFAAAFVYAMFLPYVYRLWLVNRAGSEPYKALGRNSRMECYYCIATLRRSGA